MSECQLQRNIQGTLEINSNHLLWMRSDLSSLNVKSGKMEPTMAPRVSSGKRLHSCGKSPCDFDGKTSRTFDWAMAKQ